MEQDKWSRSERNGLEGGVHLPKAAASRSNVVWLAGRPFTSSFQRRLRISVFLPLVRTHVTGRRHS